MQTKVVGASGVRDEHRERVAPMVSMLPAGRVVVEARTHADHVQAGDRAWPGALIEVAWKLAPKRRLQRKRLACDDGSGVRQHVAGNGEVVVEAFQSSLAGFFGNAVEGLGHNLQSEVMPAGNECVVAKPDLESLQHPRRSRWVVGVA